MYTYFPTLSNFCTLRVCSSSSDPSSVEAPEFPLHFSLSRDADLVTYGGFFDPTDMSNSCMVSFFMVIMLIF